MPNNLSRLPDAELSIMLALWKSQEPLSSNEVLYNLAQKHWHIATVNKLLSRLAEKGFIDIIETSRPKKYVNRVSEDEYKRFESRSFLSRLHRNSLPSFIASLYADEGLSDEDIEDIEKLIEQKRGMH